MRKLRKLVITDHEGRTSQRGLDLNVYTALLFNLLPRLQKIEVRTGNAKPRLGNSDGPAKTAELYERGREKVLVSDVDWNEWKTFACEKI